MLDLDFGTYPFVTSSNTTIGGVCTGLGLPPSKIGPTYGVVKAYTTRVGAGPFPTERTGVCSLIMFFRGEIFDADRGLQDIGVHFQEVGAEYGTTTGRRRRCGWLDTVVLKHSTRINGYTGLNLTKLDVLDDLDQIQVGVTYKKNGVPLKGFPADLELCGAVEVEYVTLPGWKQSIQDIRRWEDLPPNCRAYVEFIEKEVGVPVQFIGTGPAREASECTCSSSLRVLAD